MIRNNYIEKLIKYRSEDFDETYEYVTLKNGEKAIMFFPRSISDSIIITIFIGQEYCRLLATFNDVDRTVFLGDIQVLQDKFMSVGIGTILLEKLIEIARNERVEKITGWMNYESEEQKKRQINYYTKNGFVIDEKNNLLYEMFFE